MINKKIRAFIFGVIPMTLMQYYYWNWMIKCWTNQIDGLSYPEEDLIIPVLVTLIYCIYEKFIVFSVFFNNTTFRDRIPLAVLWVLESVIGANVSSDTIWHYDQQLSETRRFIAFGPAMCLLFAIGMIVWFLIFRAFLYYWGKENKN